MFKLFLGVTALTLFEFTLRSMRNNMKQYYLYFLALMMSATLYFVFASLQNDTNILSAALEDVQFSLLFQASGALLIVIVAIFMLYANSIFLKRRSKEIGLYQLIGLTQNKVALLLIIENMLLGLGALLIGVVIGALMSRLFLLILMKLVDIEGVISLSFSGSAALQTMIIFIVLVLLTIIQMLLKVYRTSLLGLFQAEREGEAPRQLSPILSAIMGLLGIALIIIGYFTSTQLSSQQLLQQIVIILSSIVMGTYLLFRVTIGWLLWRFRQLKSGQLGLKNSLSVAPIMHRLKGNASSLTLITVLSAMTLTMLAIAYSLYYSTESEARAMLPIDFIIENSESTATQFHHELQKASIDFEQHTIEAITLKINSGGKGKGSTILLLSAEALLQSGIEVRIPLQGEATWYKGQTNALDKSDVDTPYTMNIDEGALQLKVVKAVESYAVNFSISGRQLVVAGDTLDSIREQVSPSLEHEIIRLDMYHIPAKSDQATAAALYANYQDAKQSNPDIYTYTRASLQKFGLIIFTAGFLGLVFLISTGSILYFKQMTEAEQEKKSYSILRQLGFSEREIMSGIIRKQLFVFVIPLAIGLLHSSFAVKTASMLTISNIAFPAVVAMVVYTLVYFIFALLTVAYYRRIVAAAL